MSAPYVALGDSFSAGIGSDTPGTQIRRDGGFPVLLARALGLDLDYQAFIGATANDVLLFQLHAVGAETELVTITVGGNDANFVPVLIACLQPAWLSNGLVTLRLAMNHARAELPERLDRLYAAIRRAAPRAHVIAADYPRLFAGIDCQALTFFSDAEMTALNQAADDLAGLLQAGAARNGVEFVDVRRAYTGHAICQPEAWLHGLAWPLDDSFHPTAAGHAAYAVLVEPLARAALATAAPGRAGRAGGAGPIVAGAPTAPRVPGVHEGPRRRGSAERFRLPDLLAPPNLDAAERHGLDRREVEALASRLPRGQRAAAPSAQPLDAEALAGLHELDAWVRRRTGRP